jgi:hypothetical protein
MRKGASVAIDFRFCRFNCRAKKGGYIDDGAAEPSAADIAIDTPC